LNKPAALIHPDDIDCNPTHNESFDAVLRARLSRRSLLRGSVGTAAAALFGGLGVTACGDSDDDDGTPPVEPLTSLGFGAVAKSLDDAVSVPAGYTATVLYALGDPLSAGATAFKNDGSDADFDQRAGDHHDGMEYFGLSSDGTARDAGNSERGLLAMNHEATSHASSELASAYVHADGGTNTLPRPKAEVDKEVPLHGVSIVEVQKTAGVFATVPGSTYNRRITPLTAVALAGTASGSALMRTAYSADGTAARGTINNCGTGYTPWGTLLTGEENWAGYFTRSLTDDAVRADKSVVSLKRYGRAQGAASRHGWETGGADDPYARWIISQTGASADGSDDYRNELNTFGYLVEIDPYDPDAAIRKRTSLGRFAHESAAFSKLVAGQPLSVYMGDDSRGEYIYKWVSDATWAAADADNRSAGDKFLDDGKLYVAKFDADGSGEWLELNIAAAAIAGYATYTFSDQADVVVNARLAADALGATKMDRPEWCATHPVTGEVYFTLTNNRDRALDSVDAANPRTYADTRSDGGTVDLGSDGVANVNGHIVRVAEVDGDAAGTAFTWDVYLFGAQSDADASMVNLSSLTADQDFSSPDGLWFSQATGVCWIQTDDGSYTDVTNCMMLAGIPGTVGDGATKTLAYAGGPTVDTYVGKTPTADTLKRFLVGPKGCEITGCTETPDGKALFVNIQHPGESISSATVADPSNYSSHWPGNAGYGAGGTTTARPRSATIVIMKDDANVIGS
jgi:secreted PhoX family phosphatase